MTLTVAEHMAMEGVAPFELDDEVELPNGKRLKGAFARVYSLLKGSAEQKMEHRIGSQVGPAGWVPNYYLRKAWSGGNAGDRRVRQLRTEFGVRIESTRFGDENPHGAAKERSHTWLFRWVSDPEPGTVHRTPESSNRNPSNGTTLVNERVSESSAPVRFTPLAPIGRIHPVHGRLLFFTCVGNPGSGAPGPVNLAPHFRHCLAPSSRLVADLVRGIAERAKAAEIYREELAAQWSRGELRFWLEENLGKVLTLWTSPECAAAFDPLPTLSAILVKCGAEHLGDWQANSGRKSGAA